ncbi:hypothetical protein HDE_13083 [Halotydeus destructor]|nr:hypothetical protein HDE_13083 [Halotydeus destructor]
MATASLPENEWKLASFMRHKLEMVDDYVPKTSATGGLVFVKKRRQSDKWTQIDNQKAATLLIVLDSNSKQLIVKMIKKFDRKAKVKSETKELVKWQFDEPKCSEIHFDVMNDILLFTRMNNGEQEKFKVKMALGPKKDCFSTSRTFSEACSKLKKHFKILEYDVKPLFVKKSARKRNSSESMDQTIQGVISAGEATDSINNSYKHSKYLRDYLDGRVDVEADYSNLPDNAEEHFETAIQHPDFALLIKLAEQWMDKNTN